MWNRPYPNWKVLNAAVKIWSTVADLEIITGRNCRLRSPWLPSYTLIVSSSFSCLLDDDVCGADGAESDSESPRLGNGLVSLSPLLNSSEILLATIYKNQQAILIILFR